MIETLAIANYRSLRELIVPLGRLNLITATPSSSRRISARPASSGKDSWTSLPGIGRSVDSWRPPPKLPGLGFFSLKTTLPIRGS